MKIATGPAAFACLLSISVVSTPCAAQDETEWRFYWENDKFDFFGDNSDRYYTNGLRLDIPGRPQTLDSTFIPGVDHADWCRVLCGDDSGDGKVVAGFAVGQNMYTPADITIERRQPYDRPWAGLLYLSRFATVSYEDEALGAQRQDRLEATLGIVGPASLAGPTQILWHRLGGWERPEGWDNQLRHEPVVQLQYATARRWPPDDGGNWDIIPRVRANLGNALVSLDAEATVRLGWNLSGFGSGLISTAPPPPPAFWQGLSRSGGGDRKWLRSAALFARAGVKAIAHNIFLDGNTFARNDIRIDRKPIVTEWAAGAEANVYGPLWLSYQYVERSGEFENWRGIEAPGHKFGSIAIAYRKAM